MTPSTTPKETPAPSPAKVALARWNALCDAHRMSDADRIAACDALIPPVKGSSRDKNGTKGPGAKMLIMSAIRDLQEGDLLGFVELTTAEVDGVNVTTATIDGVPFTPYTEVRSSKVAVPTDDLLASLADARSKFATATAMGFESAAGTQSDRVDAITAELTTRGVAVPDAS